METSIESLKVELLNSRKRNERAEVILSNLLLLRASEKDSFVIPFDDVLVTIEIALEILSAKSFQ